MYYKSIAFFFPILIICGSPDGSLSCKAFSKFCGSPYESLSCKAFSKFRGSAYESLSCKAFSKLCGPPDEVKQAYSTVPSVYIPLLSNTASKSSMWLRGRDQQSSTQVLGAVRQGPTGQGPAEMGPCEANPLVLARENDSQPS